MMGRPPDTDMLKTRAVLGDVRAFIRACDAVARAERSGIAADIDAALRTKHLLHARLADFTEALSREYLARFLPVAERPPAPPYCSLCNTPFAQRPRRSFPNGARAVAQEPAP